MMSVAERNSNGDPRGDFHNIQSPRTIVPKVFSTT